MQRRFVRASVRGLAAPWIRGLLGALVLLSAGCEVSPVSPVHRPAQQLAGTWRWVSSSDVKTQRLHTPTTEGFEAEIRFEADGDRSGTYTYRRQGGPTVQGRFDIASEDAPGNDFIVLERGIDFLARNAWVAAGRDSLYLGGVMELGYNSRYARVSR